MLIARSTLYVLAVVFVILAAAHHPTIRTHASATRVEPRGLNRQQTEPDGKESHSGSITPQVRQPNDVVTVVLKLLEALKHPRAASGAARLAHAGFDLTHWTPTPWSACPLVTIVPCDATEPQLAPGDRDAFSQW